MECSVIISTCNRAESLKETLRAFGRISIPAGWTAELILVDNASTDDTTQVIQNTRLDNFKIVYLYEGRAGKSHALNTALAVAKGKALLFTDDDVVPAQDWLEKIATPLLQNEAQAVVGRIELAKELCRPWMIEHHKICLAAANKPGGDTLQLIGANMGFHRRVLECIPGFDPELGPGASGLAEETLFSWQLNKAGFSIKYLPEASVVHFPDASRLLRKNWLSFGRKQGASNAYILYHWQHEKLKTPWLRFYFIKLKLLLRRIVNPPVALDAEGAAPWEISYVSEIEKYRKFLGELQRPRNYSRHGLHKHGQHGQSTAA